VYCGRKQTKQSGRAQTIDDRSGPDAVVRNLRHVLPADRTSYYVVAIDRFYTSTALALLLLAMRVYTVGTVQIKRLGFPDAIKDTRTKRGKAPRGGARLAVHKDVPLLVACSWMDSAPEYSRRLDLGR
jgi:hypothetical protein